jgi:hypothetical protein
LPAEKALEISILLNISVTVAVTVNSINLLNGGRRGITSAYETGVFVPVRFDIIVMKVFFANIGNKVENIRCLD